MLYSCMKIACELIYSSTIVLCIYATSYYCMVIIFVRIYPEEASGWNILQYKGKFTRA